MSFGIEGVLYRRSFIMYDEQTKSHWVHATGEAVAGELKGKYLRLLPSRVLRWRQWKMLHPKTTVLVGKRTVGQAAYFGVAGSLAEYGVSVGQGKAPKLYPMSLLAKARLLNDKYAGRPILLLWDEVSETGTAYERGGHTFSLTNGKLVDEAGLAWDPLRGSPVGHDADPLKPVVSTPWLTLQWKDFYPHGEVHGRAPR